MDLGSGDRARLREIEAELTETDPDLATALESFRSDGGPPTPRGWSAVPAWAIVVFLAGFVTWMMTPILGIPVAVIGTVWLVVDHLSRQAERRRGNRAG